jgi:mono/diheme cytochrome c family protein
MMTRAAIAAVLFCVLTSGPVQAAGSVVRGRALALEACTPCHVVEAYQSVPPVVAIPVPSFESIVARKDTTERSLRAFLADTHRNRTAPLAMPDPRLTRAQIDDVVAYMLSLRKLRPVRWEH